MVLDSEQQTASKLSAITDEGLFERLATAVLRQATPDLYANLTQPGVNANGKTIKGPVDGISFVPGACPRHMIAAHHTSGSRTKLKRKWLHDPSTVKPQEGTRSTTPAGDLIKTIAIANEEREENPDIRVTLALTTNDEPTEDVTREVEAVAHANGIVLDIWSRERLAHYLDNDSNGQWLRQKYLGIAQRRLSTELLRHISQLSLQAHCPPAKEDALIDRECSQTMVRDLARPVGFLVGESGCGKTIASYRLLASYVQSGRCGMVLTHDLLSAAFTIDQAIDSALRRLHPLLEANSGVEARALCSVEEPLLIVVEDINNSGEAVALMERLAGWAPTNEPGTDAGGLTWRIICPVWPQLLAGLRDETRKRVESLAVSLGPFTQPDARNAIERRAALAGVAILPLDVDATAEALGYDPLLIALYDLDAMPDAHKVIGQFISSSTGRLASTSGTYVAQDYRTALQDLAVKMLQRRTLDPTWDDVCEWLRDPTDRQAFRELMKHAEIIRVIATDNGSRLAFRHDRVRLWLLVDGALAALRSGQMDDAVFSEPFFAEIIGCALSEPSLPASLAVRAGNASPLALFYALKSFREPTAPIHHATIAAIEQWLSDAKVHGRAVQTLRWTALHVLSETDSSLVIRIVERFRDKGWSEILAKLRHGDLGAGLRLCRSVEPGSNAPWRDRQIAHTLARYGDTFVNELDRLLSGRETNEADRVGALRLAGHVGRTSLSGAIAQCWALDPVRHEHLADYLWAAAQCGGGNTESLLGPLCDAWAALSDEKGAHGSSPRNSLASHDVQWAFSRALPESAMRYFIRRAAQEELRWPIAFMMHGVDHADAVEFIVRELAATARRIEDTERFSSFPESVVQHWERKQRDGKPMSPDSMHRLQELWGDQTNDKHLRQQSFRIWAATSHPAQIALLRAVTGADVLKDDVLRARLERGDKAAIPEFIVRIGVSDRDYWWQFGRTIWSEELTAALDNALARRALQAERKWGATYASDWITSELVMRQRLLVAENLLIKHWAHLKYSPNFVQAALYVSTPVLRQFVRQAVDDCPNPAQMFEFIDMHFGVRTFGHPGITRIEQLDGLIPYLDYINDSGIYAFWGLCNERGWINMRRTQLDGRLGQWRKNAGLDDETLMMELDEELKRDHHWLDHWVEWRMKDGRSRDAILDVVDIWLKRHKGNVAAMEVAAAVITHAGTRCDVDRLAVGSDESEEAAAIVTDTRFAVARRTLS